ncbi:Trypsin domain containing protein [Asbolus verrucosus]|uniref:Trypsin domain containing protein n=1 Tax=Asbolus verrucosus TaxID=1661398 RepID=A0A482VXP4_ASBVE|nr:Trypsin domain containing protein [Asbolus verrucosus]
MTKRVQLVCVDWDNKLLKEFKYPKIKGYTPLCKVNRGTGLVSNNRYDNKYYLTGIATCGVKSVKAQTLIVHGNNVTKGDYPWQVAIYRTEETTAHCVTDEVGSKFSEKLYTVAVGKYYRDYYHPDDKNAQFSSLIDIFVPDQYQGELQNYVGDIAVLITETSFVLSREVQPICVDWEAKYETHILRPTATGFVRKTVCKGDSGGGLVFKNRIDGRYYIEGIVSLSPQSPTGGCDSQQFALYTKVGQYVKSFILKKVQLYWR